MDPAVVLSAVVGAATLVKDALEWIEQHRQNGDEVLFLQRRQELLAAMVLDLQDIGSGGSGSSSGGSGGSRGKHTPEVLLSAVEAVLDALFRAGDAVHAIAGWSRARRFLFAGDIKARLTQAQSRLSSTMTDMAACLQIECYRRLVGGPAASSHSEGAVAALPASPSRLASAGRLSPQQPPTPPTPEPGPEAWAGQDLWEEHSPDPQVEAAVEQLRAASDIPAQLAALGALQRLLGACPAHQTAVEAAGGLTLVVRMLCCDGHLCVLANAASVLRRLVAGHAVNQEAAARDEELLPSLSFWLGCGDAQMQEACLAAFCELAHGQPGLLRRVAAPGNKLIPALLRLMDEGASLAARSHAAEALYTLTCGSEACRARVAAELPC